jgi:hypothetical protein
VRLKWHGARAKARIRDGAAEGLWAAGEMVFEASQRAVPEDTGRLKQSGELTVDEQQLRATIRYGAGISDPRAEIIHEKLEIQHDSGTAKFLENPMIERAGKVGQVIAADIKKKLT